MFTLPNNYSRNSHNPSGMTSLYPSLIRLIERVIQRPTEGFSISILTEHESVWPRIGRQFSLQKENTTTSVFPWLGIYDTAMGPILYIGIIDHQEWCQPVYEAALKKQLPEGLNFRRPYVDLLRGELCFALKDEKSGWLLLGQHGDIHEKMLYDFFVEVVRVLGKSLV